MSSPPLTDLAIESGNFKLYLKVLAKSAAFLKINYASNQVQIMDIFVGASSKNFQFDKIFNEYADPLRLEQIEECLLRWENVCLFAFTNDKQSLGLFQREGNMIRNFITAIPQNLIRITNQKQLNQNPSSISIIKSNAMGGNKDVQSKILKLSMSFYALSNEGALDFGKFTVEKFKTKKDPQDIEKVPVFNQIIEDNKNQEMVIKGISKYETLDFEQILNYFNQCQAYYQEYLSKKFDIREDKIFHQVLQLTFWSPQEPNKKRSNLYIIDFATPVQSIDPQFISQNQFLAGSLLGISTYLKEFYRDKQAVTPHDIEYDSNYLMRILKKVLTNSENVNLFPLFYINSQEDYKDESKQILQFTQQIQGVFKLNDDLAVLSPKSGQQNESIMGNQMVEKLSKENNDLKKQIDFMKKVYKGKLDEFRILLGIDVDLEALIKARPNSKEMQALKFFREAKERAETLGRINRDLEKKLYQLQHEVDEIRSEKGILENKYWKQFRAMESKVEKMKQDIQIYNKECGDDIQEEKQQRIQNLQQKITQEKQFMTDKANILFKLKDNTENNTDLIGRLFDLQDQARKDQEHQYKTELDHKLREHVEEIENLKEQYSFLIEEEEQKLQTFIDQFKNFKQHYQQEIGQNRDELINLYSAVHQQQTLITSIEDGKYNQGFHSHYVPPALKPLMPNKESHKNLFEAISKKKVLDSISTQNYIDKTKVKQKLQEEFMEQFMMKTMTIRQQGAEQVSKWNERLKSFDYREYEDQYRPQLMAQKQQQQKNKKNNSKQRVIKKTQESSKNTSPKLSLMRKESSMMQLTDIMKSEKIEDIDPQSLSYTDLQHISKELQREYKKLGQSNLNPTILEGEPLKKIIYDIDKFKTLYEIELKISNERIFNEGKQSRLLQQFPFAQQTLAVSTSRPQTRQLISSQSAFRLGQQNTEEFPRMGLQTGSGLRNKKMYNLNANFDANAIVFNAEEQRAQTRNSQSRQIIGLSKGVQQPISSSKHLMFNP